MEYIGFADAKEFVKVSGIDFIEQNLMMSETAL